MTRFSLLVLSYALLSGCGVDISLSEGSLSSQQKFLPSQPVNCADPPEVSDFTYSSGGYRLIWETPKTQISDFEVASCNEEQCAVVLRVNCYTDGRCAAYLPDGSSRVPGARLERIETEADTQEFQIEQNSITLEGDLIVRALQYRCDGAWTGFN